MENIYRSTIEENYNFKIVNIDDGPRQFFAETYLIHTSEGESFFCKINDRPIIIPEIIRGLPILEEMHNKGIEKINFPIRGKNGLFCMVGAALVVLFSYIPAPQHYEYSEYALGKLLAEIHAITPRLTVRGAHEDFHYLHRLKFEQCFEEMTHSEADDKALHPLAALLRKYEDEIRYFYGEYRRLCDICNYKGSEMVITHGDAPGNVLVKSFNDIYLIDWDGILLAPAEWDLWMMDHHPKFMEGYKSIRPKFTIDNDLRSVSVYKYYFESFMHYFEEIFGDFSTEHRMRYICELESNLIRGWMIPKLKDINPTFRFI